MVKMLMFPTREHFIFLFTRFLSNFKTSIIEELDAILASKLGFKLELKTENVEDKKS